VGGVKAVAAGPPVKEDLSNTGCSETGGHNEEFAVSDQL
jgi:hypothetical protein